MTIEVEASNTFLTFTYKMDRPVKMSAKRDGKKCLASLFPSVLVTYLPL